MSERKAMLAWALPSEKEESEAKASEIPNLFEYFLDKPSASIPSRSLICLSLTAGDINVLACVAGLRVERRTK